MSQILANFILLCLCTAVSGLYFHIAETEKKCFIEEIPDDTIVVGHYKVEIFDKAQNQYLPTVAGLGMHVEVKDPDEKVVLSRTYAADGRFTFTSHVSGEHVICLHSNSSAWFGGGQLRVHLDIQVGEHAVDYQQVAAKDKLTELQLRIRQLLDQVEMITKEQNYQRRVHLNISSGEEAVDYREVSRDEKLSSLETRVRQLVNQVIQMKREQDYQRYREERFRQTSESTNQRVLWWAIAQTVILLSTGFWQMRHLKSFFEAKKLV
ncbi:Transmembrane emp24 domain-containing protein eca [Lamellibrachia satsuma]|nr:Transmembrane emp24 domain-containing protein eca [Lamellibrachia satsuma]